jgi:hypothetical protein
LASPVFGLESTYSEPAERAMRKARELLARREQRLEDILAVDQELRATLGDVDPFWIRWSAFVEQRLAEIGAPTA